MRKVYCDLCPTVIGKVTKNQDRHTDHVERKLFGQAPRITCAAAFVRDYISINFDLCDECQEKIYNELVELDQLLKWTVTIKEDFKNDDTKKD